MLNSITLHGRLVRDPEYRLTQSQKGVATWTLAVDRDFTNGEKQTDFIDCCGFSKLADHVHSYYTKGSSMIAQGRLQIREWTDKDGNKRRSAEVVCDRVWFGESKKGESKEGFTPAQKPVNVSAFEDLEDPGELPF